MTRGQVAKRLGKSLATVRRIEGVLLHSVQDTQGVHRFNADEVDALAQKLEGGQTTLWQALRGTTDSANLDKPESELEAQVESLRAELEQEKRRHRHELEALHAEHERERLERDAERREFETQVAEFMSALNELNE